MSAGRVVVFFGLTALALPALGTAQGLGDAAAREKARRAAARKAEARTFTNDDLSAGRPPGAAVEPGAATEGGASPDAGAPASTNDGSLAESRRTLEAPFIDAVNAAQGEVAAAEARVTSLQNKLNPMSGDFIYGATGSNNANEEAEVRQQLTEAQAQLQAARQALTASAQALADFREGRRAPPANE
jgi:hypothetical protein